MFRIIWFAGCVVVAILLAVIGQSLIPFAITAIAPGGVSHGIYDLLIRSNIVQLASSISLFCVFLTFLGLGGQVLVDALATRRASRELEALKEKSSAKGISTKEFRKALQETGDLANTAERYIDAGDINDVTDRLSVPYAAERFFGKTSQIRARLHLWFYEPVVGLLIAIGVVLLLLSLVSGIDEILFQSRISARQPLSGLLVPLQTGLFGLAIAVASAFFVRFMTRLFVHVRETQLSEFCLLLDLCFGPNADAPGSADEGLRGSLQKLAEAQTLIAQDNSAQSHDLVEGALKEFSAQITEQFKGQVESIGSLLNDTEQQVADATKAVTAAHNTLAKYAKGQAAAIDKAITSSLSSHYKSEGTARAALTKSVDTTLSKVDKALQESGKTVVQAIEKNMRSFEGAYTKGLTNSAQKLTSVEAQLGKTSKALENMAAGLKPALDANKKQNAELIKLMNSDESAARGIVKAAEDLNRASKASRETVERFIHLAEQLKTMERKPEAAPEPTAAPRPKANKLSTALRDIKQGTAKDLPDL